MSDLAAADALHDFDTTLKLARQRLRLSRQPCQTCGGSGNCDEKVRNRTGLCPACDGSGGVWPAELVEAVAAVLHKPDVTNPQWQDDPEGSWKAAIAFGYADRYREQARAVLDAVESWMEAGE